jgi:hypothetical protein
MAFETLQTRLNSGKIPYIIAGPILRRVTKNSVTVWIASYRACSAKLEIYDHLGQTGVLQFESSFVTLEQLGDKLYIGCITASTSDISKYLLDPTQVAILPDDSEHLSKGVYTYNIRFSGLESNILELSSPGVLTKTVQNQTVGQSLDDLVYPGYTLPSFVAPTEDHTKLHIIHGSCRKPHGEGKDAFRGADNVIHASREKATERPQIMFLTGDQIYADDVSQTLLKLLVDAQDAILNFDEPFPLSHVNQIEVEIPEAFPPLASEPPQEGEIYTPPNPINYTQYYKEESSQQLPNIYVNLQEYNINTSKFSFAPGQRDGFIKLCAGFSADSEASKNHLITLGEYYAMYLFVWSDVLWPMEDEDNDNFPEFEQIYNTSKTAGRDVTVPFKAIKISLPYRKKIYRNFIEEKNALKKFKKGNRKVRRAMANCATYMMFDDHEITDDWFINLDWTARVLGGYEGINNPEIWGRSSGKRIISNGLSAYMIFQAWGNKPNDQTYLNIIEKIKGLSLAPEPDRNAAFNILQNAILPTLSKQFIRYALNKEEQQDGTSFISTDFDCALEAAHLLSPVDWSFQLTTGSITYLSVDTRTKRGFVNWFYSTSQGELYPYVEGFGFDFPFSNDNQAGTLPMDLVRRLFLKQPASLISDYNLKTLSNTLESLQEPEILVVISPPPVFGHPMLEGLVPGLLLPNSGINYLQVGPLETLDAEQWIFQQDAYEDFIAILSSFKRVLLLSGDVHYSYLKRTHYWNLREESETDLYQEPSSVLIQATSSSFKNEVGFTRKVVPNLPKWSDCNYGFQGYTNNSHIFPLQDYYTAWSFENTINLLKPTSEVSDKVKEAAQVYQHVEDVIQKAGNVIVARGANDIFNSNVLYTIQSSTTQLINSYLTGLTDIAEATPAALNSFLFLVNQKDLLEEFLPIIGARLLNISKYIDCIFYSWEYLYQNSTVILQGRPAPHDANDNLTLDFSQWLGERKVVFDFMSNICVLFTNTLESTLIEGSPAYITVWNTFLNAQKISFGTNCELVSDPNGESLVAQYPWLTDLSGAWPCDLSGPCIDVIMEDWETLNDHIDWLFENGEKIGKLITWLDTDKIVNGVFQRNSSEAWWDDPNTAIKSNWNLNIAIYLSHRPDWVYRTEFVEDSINSVNNFPFVKSFLRLIQMNDILANDLKIDLVHNLSLLALNLLSGLILKKVKFALKIRRRTDDLPISLYDNALIILENGIEEVEQSTEVKNLIVQLDDAIRYHTLWSDPAVTVDAIDYSNPANRTFVRFMHFQEITNLFGTLGNQSPQQITAFEAFQDLIGDALEGTLDFALDMLAEALLGKESEYNNQSALSSAFDGTLDAVSQGIVPSYPDHDGIIGVNNIAVIKTRMMQTPQGSQLHLEQALWVDPKENTIPGFAGWHSITSDPDEIFDGFLLPFMKYLTPFEKNAYGSKPGIPNFIPPGP